MKAKALITIFAGVLLISVASAMLLAANDDNPGRGRKPDKLKPVHATDIEVVNKITVRGKPPWAGGGGGKKKEGAATGVLGDEVVGTRYAVVVGISEYPGDDSDLEYCDDDAMEIAGALDSVYGFDDITLLTESVETTRSAILGAIDDIPIDADEIVFFFSGHGAHGIADDGDKETRDEAIVAHNGTDLVPIWDGELAGAFSEFETSRIICIFDTCLAGGMARDLEEPGRVVAMACGENGLSYESSEWQNGEFTYYFVDKGILAGMANAHDYDGDGSLEEREQVTIEEAFDYAKANCVYDKPTLADEFDDDLLP